METISNETRNRKAAYYEPEDALSRWVAEYAEAHNITKEEVIALALFRLERERIYGEKNELHREV